MTYYTVQGTLFNTLSWHEWEGRLKGRGIYINNIVKKLYSNKKYFNKSSKAMYECAKTLADGLLLLSHFSRVWLCVTPSLGFSRQEHWSGLPFPSPMNKSEKWKWSHSVMVDSSWSHVLQPTRLLCPWDFPGKSTGVGCHCLLQLKN